MSGPSDDLFREEALSHLAEPELGSVLKLAPSWVHWSWWLLLAAGLSCTAFVAMSSVTFSVAGTGVIRVDSPTMRDMSSRAERRSRCTLAILMPAQARPRLTRGMELRCEVRGYRGAEIVARIDSLGDHTMDSATAARFLGVAVSEAAALGPVIPVFAHLESDRFVSAGRAYAFADGMSATARVSLARERLIDRLLPTLKAT